MLTTNRSLVENSTGKSVGLAPFRIVSIAPSQGTGPSWGGGRHFSADNPARTICPVRTRTPPPIRQQRATPRCRVPLLGLALLSASEAIASNSLTMSFRGMLRSANERILASRSIIYSLRLLQLRHEQAVGHALLKVPDHRRLACRDRDCQRLARRRSELDDIGPVALRAEDHDPVVAGHYSRPVLWHSSSASRFTAAAPGFFILSQSGERPQR